MLSSGRHRSRLRRQADPGLGDESPFKVATRPNSQSDKDKDVRKSGVALGGGSHRGGTGCMVQWPLSYLFPRHRQSPNASVSSFADPSPAPFLPPRRNLSPCFIPSISRTGYNLFYRCLRRSRLLLNASYGGNISQFSLLVIQVVYYNRILFSEPAHIPPPPPCT